MLQAAGREEDNFQEGKGQEAKCDASIVGWALPKTVESIQDRLHQCPPLIHSILRSVSQLRN